MYLILSTLYHYFLTFLNHIHLSHLYTSSKIPSHEESGPSIRTTIHEQQLPLLNYVESSTSRLLQQSPSPKKSGLYFNSYTAGRCDNNDDGCPFDRFRTLCTISWKAALWWRHLHSPHHQLAMKRPSGKYVCSQKPNHNTKFFAGPSFQCSYYCTSTHPKNSTWLTYSSAICYTYYIC